MRDRLNQTDEKTFLKEVLARYALTAARDAFDDCIVIDPVELFGVELPYIVYSIDHPSRIKRPLAPGLADRFYGRWIAGCTCGDVLAMGAQPRGFSVDLALPMTSEVGQIEDIYAGISDVLERYGARFEGGNLDISRELEIVGMCWGTVERASIIRRSGARAGDYIAVTTEPGLGWASYLLCRSGQFDRLGEASRVFFTRYNELPVANHRAIREAVATPRAITSGMDLTDGLIEFLYTIQEREALGALIDECQMPLPEPLREAASLLDVPPALLGLDPGYDTPRIHGYTVAPEHWETVRRAFTKHGGSIHRLGTVTESPEILWRTEKGSRPLPRFWDDQFAKDSVVDRWAELTRSLRH